MRMLVHLTYMEVRFYCRICGAFIIRNDAIKRKVLDQSGDSRYYCPKCDFLLLKVCKDCEKGIMRIAREPIPLGDFNKGGQLEPFCDLCGHGFIQFTPGTKNNGNGFSKRKIKKVIDAVFTRNHLKYRDKKALMTELLTKCNDKETTINFLSDRCGEDRAYLQEKL